MCYNACMSTITLSQTKITKQKGVVVLPVKEYQRLLSAAVPTHYLTGKAASRLDKLVENGLREHREGKTINADSLGEAVKKHKAHVR